MKSTDTVTLVVVTHHNSFGTCQLSWADAEKCMKDWFNQKQSGNIDPSKVFSYRLYAEDRKEFMLDWVVQTDQIIGMFVNLPPPKDDYKERLMKTQESILDIVKKEADRGEEWREED